MQGQHQHRPFATIDVTTRAEKQRVADTLADLVHDPRVYKLLLDNCRDDALRMIDGVCTTHQCHPRIEDRARKILAETKRTDCALL